VVKIKFNGEAIRSVKTVYNILGSPRYDQSHIDQNYIINVIKKYTKKKKDGNVIIDNNFLDIPVKTCSAILYNEECNEIGETVLSFRFTECSEGHSKHITIKSKNIEEYKKLFENYKFLNIMRFIEYEENNNTILTEGDGFLEKFSLDIFNNDLIEYRGNFKNEIRKTTRTPISHIKV